VLTLDPAGTEFDLSIAMAFIRQFFIEGRDDAEQLLHERTPSHLVSLRDVGSDPLRGAARVGDRIELEFDDATSPMSAAFGYRPPELEDIRLLTEWLSERQVALRDGSVLFQCEQGISRSTAAAIIALRILGATRDGALQVVRATRPNAMPNALMLDLAERLLGN
jgi:predicted protein tyrosine phosphatase